MHIRVISFGMNWWAMRSHDANDPFCFRRKAAYFNAAGLMSGRRLHHSAIFPGQIASTRRVDLIRSFHCARLARHFFALRHANSPGKCTCFLSDARVK